MRVLVTRSGEQGRQLAARLAASGFQVIHYAPVEPGPLGEPETLRRRLHECLPVDILVTPSAEALRQIHALLESRLPLDTLVVAPGPGTAAVATALGFGQVRYPQLEGSSERILELPELLDVAGKRVLIAAAAGGRHMIEQELRRRAALVQRLEVYARRRVAATDRIVQELRSSEALISLLASGGALEALQQQLPEDCWRRLAAQPMIAPSVRVADLALAAGCSAVHAASAADDGAMLAVLGQLCPEPG